MNNCSLLVPFRSALTHLALGTALAASAMAPALAQDKYPSRPLVVILPFAPGSSADIAANMIKAKMQPGFGQPIVIEHKAGANQILAYQTTARSRPDGYTIVYATATLASSPALIKDLPFDPLKDFTGISLISEQFFVLLMRSEFKGMSFGQYIAAAKKEPGKFSVAGQSGINLALNNMITKGAKIETEYVQYGDLPKMVNDVMGGRVHSAIVPLNTGLVSLKNGQGHILTISSPQRLPQVPDVQTMQEQVPGVAMTNWSGFFAPSRTPRETIAFLQNRINEANKSPDIQQRASEGGRWINTTADEADAVLRKEVPFWLATMKAVGVEPQ